MLGPGEAKRRIRVLSDAVNDLTAEVRRATSEWQGRSGQITIGAEAVPAIVKLAVAVERLERQLDAANGNIQRIVQNPILSGLLGGKTVEGELNSLVRSIDDGRSALREVTRLARA